jgi:hypothetical protein
MSSSSVDSVREEITRRLAAALAPSVHAAIPVSYPNRPFQQPEGQTWIKVCFLGGEGIQTNLGENPFERYVGILQLEVISPEEKGTKLSNDILDFLGKLYSRKQFYTDPLNVVTFKVPSYNFSDTPVNGYIKQIVRIAYKRNERTFSS